MKKALFVIDVQNEYFTGKLPVSYPKSSFEEILKLMDFAHHNEIMILLIQHTALKPDSPTFRRNSNEWQIHPEIISRPYTHLIEKNYPDCFSSTNIEHILKENMIDTVVITGYMTHMCCDSTSRRAFHLGYDVEFISNATGTLSISNYAGSIKAEELQRAILISQAARFSKVMTSNEWINEINKKKLDKL
jgi:nicotinamidase-related amidase